MRIDIGKDYHKPDDHAVFSSTKDCNVIWLASRTYKNGYDCSENCELELTKEDVKNIVKVAEAKGWL